MAALGRFKAFDVVKGYGFIKAEQAGCDDIFFHVRNFAGYESDILPGSKVSYVVDHKNGRNGKPCASNVKLVADIDVDSLASYRSESRASSAFTITPLGPQEATAWKKHLQEEKEKEKYETDMKAATIESLTSKFESFDRSVSQEVEGAKQEMMMKIEAVKEEIMALTKELKQQLKQQLKEELMQELKQQLKEELKQELMQDLFGKLELQREKIDKLEKEVNKLISVKKIEDLQKQIELEKAKHGI
jgi:cold shock CspA family protein